MGGTKAEALFLGWCVCARGCVYGCVEVCVCFAEEVPKCCTNKQADKQTHKQTNKKSEAFLGSYWKPLRDFDSLLKVS